MESDPKTLVQRLSRGRVLVVGDLILDRHVSGDVRRVSPEAPIQVLHVRREDSSPGGAANVACKVAELGGEAVLVGIVGNDSDAEALRDATEAFGVDCAHVLPDARPTTTKARYIARGQQLLRVDREERADVSAEASLGLIEAVSSELPRADAVVIEDYGKGVLTEPVLRAALGRAGKIPVVVDPCGVGWSGYRWATLITPNERELEAASGCRITNEEMLPVAARKMLREAEARAIAVTRGRDGITIVTADDVEHVPTSPIEVYDVTGAGDAVAAAFALALAGGLTMREAAVVANLAGRVVVRQLGVGRISRERLVEAASGGAGSASRKVVPLDEAVREVERVRGARGDKGGKVAFTNGVFDLIQPKHVYVLEEARRRGDFLVVGVNSDESVRRIKGPGRPAQSEGERARVLAALACVGLVVIFDEDTPRRLIEAIRPDVLVKGGDYAEDEVVGAGFVKSYGGKVELVPKVDAAGTSEIIARVKGEAVSEEAERREWRDE